MSKGESWNWDHQDRETLISSDNKNAMKLQCPYCSCLILNPGVGQFVEKQISIHKPKKDDSEPQLLSKHWIVDGHINFENIGVTRAVSTEYKYLMCADCELGPLGIVFLNEPALFYVADSRIKYA